MYFVCCIVMNVIMRLVHIRQFMKNVAVSAAILFSFTLGTPAAAAVSPMPMEGMPHDASPSLLNCISQHHVVPGSNFKINTDKQEDDEPQPLPYFMQFRSSVIDTTQKPPTDIVRASSYQPPDIVRQTNSIRF